MHPSTPPGFSSHTSSVPLQTEEASSPGIQALPSEVMQMIFSCLTPAEAAQARPVCRTWNAHLSDDSLWRHFAARDDLQLVRDDSEAAKPLQEIYYREMRSRQNLLNGIYSARQFDVPDLAYSCFIECFKERMLIFGDFHGNIAIIDLDTGKHVKTVNIGTNMAIRCICRGKNEGQLILGCRDGTIRVWDLERDTCERILDKHTETVRAIHLTNEGHLLSVAHDGKVIIWDLEKNEDKLILDMDQAPWVDFCQFITDAMVISIHKPNYNKRTVKVWNLETATCEKEFTLDDARSTSFKVLIKEKLLITSMRGIRLKVWDLKTGNFIKALPYQEPAIDSCFSHAGMLITTDLKGMSIWDLKTDHPTPPCKRIDLPGGISSHIDDLFLRCPSREGGLTVFRNRGNIDMVLNFNASNAEVFAEIAEQFESYWHLEGEFQEVSIARFQAMPDEDKKKIYQEFDRIWGVPGSGENAFRDPNRFYLLMAQAIRSYLRSLEGQATSSPHQPSAATPACVLF